MKYAYNLALRVLLCFVPFYAFSFLLTPLTLYLSYILLLPFGAAVSGDSISVGGYQFNIIEACVAVAAYYLIWILVLLTKDVVFAKRVKMILLGFILLLLMNIIRIAALALITIYIGFDAFESVHLIWWKFVSGIYVAGVWIFMVRYFKISSIPIYDDLKYLWGFVEKG